MILNMADYSISVREIEGEDFVEVLPGESVPFWPTKGATRVVACVTGEKNSFPFILLHS